MREKESACVCVCRFCSSGGESFVGLHCSSFFFFNEVMTAHCILKSGNWILELPGGRRCTCSIAWADDSITSSVFQTLRRRTLPEIVLGAFQLLHDSS